MGDHNNNKNNQNLIRKGSSVYLGVSAKEGIVAVETKKHVANFLFYEHCARNVSIM